MMKKFYAILLGLALVLGMATIASAASESFSASVEVTYSIDNYDLTSSPIDFADNFTGNPFAKFVIDYSKTYNDNISAGLTMNMIYDPNNILGTDPSSDTEGDIVAASDGWIIIKNLFGLPVNLTAKTGGVGSTAGNIPGAYSLNDYYDEDDADLDGFYADEEDWWNAATSAGAFFDVTLGPVVAQFLANNYGFAAQADVKIAEIAAIGGKYVKDFYYYDDEFGYALWASVTPIEGLKVKGEVDYNSWEGFAWFAEASYTFMDGALSVMAGYEDFTSWTFAGVDDWPDSSDDNYMFNMVDWTMSPHWYYYYEGCGENLYGSVTFKAADFVTLSAEGNYYLADEDEWYIGGKAAFTFSPELTANAGAGYCNYDDEYPMYKIYGDVSFKVSEPLTLTANAAFYSDGYNEYTGYILGAGATYAFVEGVTGSASFAYTADGYDDEVDYSFTVGLKAVL